MAEHDPEGPDDAEAPVTDDGHDDAVDGFTPRRAGDILKGLWQDRSPGQRSKEIVNGLSKRETTLGFVAFVLIVALSLEVYLVNRHSVTLKVRQAAPELAIAGGIFAVILVVGVLVRRRAVLGFGSLMAGMELISAGNLLGVLFLGFGGWIIMRWMNLNRQTQAARREAGAARRSEKAKATVRTGPPAKSKRYTPPRRRGLAPPLDATELDATKTDGP